MFSSPTYRSAEAINTAMARVYFNMFLAVLTSMLTGYLVSTNAELMTFLFTGAMKWVVIFAPLVFIFLVPVMLNAGIGYTGAQVVLHSFAALMGVSLATVFAVYTMGSIVSAFMGAAVLFGVMSFYGYFTKQDLSSFGKYLFIALISIIIVSIINLFIGSGPLAMLISAIAIIVFLGLTAYDTQRIRDELMTNDSYVVEVSGAISLYLNFINLFINLLQLFGVKKD